MLNKIKMWWYKTTKEDRLVRLERQQEYLTSLIIGVAKLNNVHPKTLQKQVANMPEILAYFMAMVDKGGKNEKK